MNQQNLPNATISLVLGILSIITCCCFGPLGIIIGGIGLYLANKDEALYQTNPGQYLNYGNVKAGKTLSIIGIILGILSTAYIIFIGMTFGWDAFMDPQLLQERMNEWIGERS